MRDEESLSLHRFIGFSLVDRNRRDVRVGVANDVGWTVKKMDVLRLQEAHPPPSWLR